MALIFVCRRKSPYDPSREIPCKKHLIVLDMAITPILSTDDVMAGCRCMYCQKSYKGVCKIIENTDVYVISNYYADIDSECQAGESDAEKIGKELATCLC
jgi:hypothetical protein